LAEIGLDLGAPSHDQPITAGSFPASDMPHFPSNLSLAQTKALSSMFTPNISQCWNHLASTSIWARPKKTQEDTGLVERKNCSLRT